MIDFNKRLSSLKDRRQGSRERAIYDKMESLYAFNAIISGSDVRKKESYETINETSGIRYTIGAMSPVDTASTQVSIAEGERVADSLIKSLNCNGEDVISKIQGSVPLDIHIKGHSDVDMLIIVNNPINIELPAIYPNSYTNSTDHRSLVEIAKEIRNKSEKILNSNFPKAKVDITGNKSISISEGSLKRKVDIVPSIWHHGRDYQQSGESHLLGVKIYHKGNHNFILNHPFKHIYLVNQRDRIYSGNLKCVVRLLKNLCADMPDYKKNTAKNLSSYDLTAICYNMDEKLNTQSIYRLGLVEKLREHLKFIINSSLYRESLNVPDQSRKIFDDQNKFEALKIFYGEIEDLAVSIYSELNPYSPTYNPYMILNKAVA